MIFESDRLYFREILPDDAEAMFELDADPDVHRFLGQHPIVTMDQAREQIQMIKQQYVDNGVGRLIAYFKGLKEVHHVEQFLLFLVIN